MVRRLLSYGVVGLLVVALIGGTAYILLNQEENRSGAAVSEGRGWGSEAESEAGSSGGRGRTGTNDTETESQGGGNGGSEGNGGGQGRGSSGGGSGEANEDIAWETVTGAVVAVDGEVTLQTATGEVIVGMGQSRYWEGFSMEIGDEVSVIGFHEDGEFKAGTVKNLTSGESIVLRDHAGHPMWAGGGRSDRQA
jgi:hypothetical protein